MATTALAEAMRVMRGAVATTDEAIASIPRKKAAGDPLRYEAVGMAEANEAEAGRVLLVALDGIPERIAALEKVAVAARKLAQSCEVVADDEAPWTYSYGAVNRVYSALTALPGGVDS